MQVKVGEIIEGKVTGLTNFGAFIKLSTGETGMVHISEVSTVYIKDIKEHLAENQEVKVKVLAFGDNGKISLSIKQALPVESRPKSNSDYASRQENRTRKAPVNTNANDETSSENQAFEAMMTKFKQVSDEKMTDLKRSSESKHGGGYSRRGSGR